MEFEDKVLGIYRNPEIRIQEYQAVKVVQDDDGHNYVIPAEDYEDFSMWLEMDPYYQDEEKEETRVALDQHFEIYRTGGDLNLKLYAKVGYEKEF